MGVDNLLIEISRDSHNGWICKNFVDKILEVGFDISEVPIKLVK